VEELQTVVHITSSASAHSSLFQRRITSSYRLPRLEIIIRQPFRLFLQQQSIQFLHTTLVHQIEVRKELVDAVDLEICVEVVCLEYLKATNLVRASAKSILALILHVAFVTNGSEVSGEFAVEVKASQMGASSDTRDLSTGSSEACHFGFVDASSSLLCKVRVAGGSSKVLSLRLLNHVKQVEATCRNTAFTSSLSIAAFMAACSYVNENSAKAAKKLTVERVDSDFFPIGVHDRVPHVRANDDPILITQESTRELHHHLEFAGLRCLNTIVSVAECLAVRSIFPASGLVSQLFIQKTGRHLLCMK
jgi:hypothetical protein